MNNSILTFGCILVSAVLLWCGTAAVAHGETAGATDAEVEEESGSGDEEKEKKEKAEKDKGPGSVKRFLLWSDEPHRGVSNRFDNLSRNIDSIFGAERIYEETTETHLQVRGGVRIERGGSLSLEHDLSLKIDLPKTKRRIKVTFETEDDEEDFIESDGGDSQDGDGLERTGDKDYSAALQFFIRESHRWNVSVGPGARIRTPPDPFARIRVRRTQELGSLWQIRLTERLTEYLRRGLESRTTLEFERRTDKNEIFRLSSRVLWREEFENDNIRLSQSAKLFNKLNERESIAYGAAVVWETKPNLHHELYVFDVRWRRRIHKKWLYWEVKPEIRFDRDHHFRLDPRLTLSLEVLFGPRYLHEGTIGAEHRPGHTRRLERRALHLPPRLQCSTKWK